jgi:hypothetical protein
VSAFSVRGLGDSASSRASGRNRANPFAVRPPDVQQRIGEAPTS